MWAEGAIAISRISGWNTEGPSERLGEVEETESESEELIPTQ